MSSRYRRKNLGHCDLDRLKLREPKFWEKESRHRPAPVRNFSLPKKWGAQRKDFGGRCGFPCFDRVFVSTTGLESFYLSLRPAKFPKIFSFGGGRVRFVLL